MTIEVIAVPVVAEVSPGDDLATLLLAHAQPRDGDVVVVTQKVVSKSEGQLVALGDVLPSPRAIALAGDHSDPRFVEVVLRESARVVRQRGPLLVTETHHGFVCANAGVDRSNAPAPDTVVLLPRDPDASARRLRDALRARGVDAGVIVADTMGRAWREGIVGTALGAAGVTALRRLDGAVDPAGYELRSTAVAIADELAAAADLVLGKLERVPFALVRGSGAAGEGSGADLIRTPGRDLFR